jgi:hypothetical protein
MKKFLIFLIVVSFFIGCSHPKDPCANLICKDNQECVNGNCQCVTDSYNMGKWCAQKKSGTMDVFYSKSDNCGGCLASDTSVIYFSGRNETGIGGYTFMMAFPKDEKFWLTSVGAGEDGQNYYKLASGDSFKLYQPIGLVCRQNIGKPKSPIVYGKLNPLKDSLKLKIVWYDASPGTISLVPLDSCTKLFTR